MSKVKDSENKIIIQTPIHVTQERQSPRETVHAYMQVRVDMLALTINTVQSRPPHQRNDEIISPNPYVCCGTSRFDLRHR